MSEGVCKGRERQRTIAGWTVTAEDLLVDGRDHLPNCPSPGITLRIPSTRSEGHHFFCHFFFFPLSL